MSTNPLILLAILVAILIIAVSTNYYFHQREKRERERQLRSQQLKKEIQQTLDALSALKTAQTPRAILELLTEHSAQLIGQLANLNPAAGVIDQLRSQTATPAELGPSTPGVHAVKLIQSAIRTAFTILRLQQQRGRITALELAEFGKELTWLHSESEADIYINEGRKLLENDKRGLALSHFRHAKTLIGKVSSREPRRAEKLELIRQLNDSASPFKPASDGDQS